MRDASLERFKGLLIGLIVLGHNYVFSQHYPNAFSFIYGFHVISFLLFAYLFVQPQIKPSPLNRRLFRILAPHAVFLSIAIVIYCCRNVLLDSLSMADWGGGLMRALLEQRETLFREHVGAGFLWFLPALAIQSLLIYVYQSAITVWRGVLLLLGLLVHLGLGTLDNEGFFQLPFSLSLVGYLFIIGIAISWLWRNIHWSSITTGVLIVVWVVASYFSFQNDFFHPIAGDFYDTPLSVYDPLTLLARDAFIVLSFFFFLRVSAVCNFNFLGYTGARSLQVFLLHPFVWHMIWIVGLRSVEISSSCMALLFTAGSFVLTMAVTLGLISLLERTPLSGVLFPGSPRDWGLKIGQ